MDSSAGMFSQVTMLVNATVSGVKPLASRERVEGVRSSSPASCRKDNSLVVRAASRAACRLATSMDVAAIGLLSGSVDMSNDVASPDRDLVLAGVVVRERSGARVRFELMRQTTTLFTRRHIARRVYRLSR